MMEKVVPRLALSVLILVLSAVTVPAGDDGVAEEPDPPSSSLISRGPGEPYFAPLLRVRAEEPTYRETRWWPTYNQLRAQAEAAAGNHHEALAAWDAVRGPIDSVGVLPEGTRAVDAIEYLAGIADTAQVIMVNERHHAASDRLLTLRLLEPLRARGFRYFAAEAFSDRDSLLNERAYPVEATGSYTAEPVFAEVVREARRLGYTLVPYEQTAAQSEDVTGLTRQQQRDRAQARNLHERTLRGDPRAKILVHAGYSHILEKSSERWYPMALYFHEMTGVDPVTVDQTRLSERSAPGFEHHAYRAAIEAGLLRDEPVVLLDGEGKPLLPAGFAVDLQVLSPRSDYWDGRPAWMALAGRRIPVKVDLPEGQACFVEVRAAGEAADAIPLGRAEAIGTARLFLPPGRKAEVKVFTATGDLLRHFDHIAEVPKEP